jgi:hypothetical protein
VSAGPKGDFRDRHSGSLPILSYPAAALSGPLLLDSSILQLTSYDTSSRIAYADMSAAAVLGWASPVLVLRAR